MNIGMIHQRTGGNCGVALEMDKMRKVLEAMGHEVFYCTGEGTGHLIPELHLENPEEARISRCAFGFEKCSEQELQLMIEKRIAFIKPRIEEFIDSYNIQLLVVQNIWAVLSHIGTGLALKRIVEERRLPTWSHNHDFHWEFENPLKPAFHSVKRMLDEDFPPVLPTVKHIVINSVARNDLASKRVVDSIVIPNVIDSDLVKKIPSPEDSADFRGRLGISMHDMIVMCGTRVIPHKYIEAAIMMASELDTEENRLKLMGAELSSGLRFSEQSRIIFVVCGKPEFFSGWYQERLKRLGDEHGLRNLWIGNNVSGLGSVRSAESLGSLFDLYCHADLITYTTIHEGWGNQLLEGMAARKPMVICEYPIFLTDIEKFGFKLLSFGRDLPKLRQNDLMPVDAHAVKRLAREITTIMTNMKRKNSIVDHNLSVLERELSFAKLEEIFRMLLAES